jgi:peptide/nickel transport system permease protein
MVANDFAFLIRLIKKQTIEQKHQLYVKMAIAKGLDEKSILTRHILPNVGIQILSVFTGSIPAAFAGSLIVEVIFNIPGMGRLLYHSINSSDWNVVFGILIVLAFLTIMINIIGDFMYVRLNPKISYHE